MRTFFFSYRRDDAEAEAGRIADRFHASVGRDEVFFDTMAIDGGDRWMKRIDEALSEAQVMLVIIGRSWLTLPGANGQPRLFDPQDVVAREIASALDRGIRIIPVRVQGTPLPRADALPPALVRLVGFNDHEVRSGPAFDRDVESLIDSASGRRRGWRRWMAPGRTGAATAVIAVLGVAALSAWLADQPASTEAPALLESPSIPVASRPPDATSTAAAPAATSIPQAFDMQLQVTLRDTPGDDRHAPEMKLWHRHPNPNRASNINLLDQAREIARGVLDYVSPIPTMPAQGEQYEGLLHRLTLTGQANADPTRVCFTADLASNASASRKEPVVRMTCTEGRACRVADDDVGWARPCEVRPAPVSWWPFVSQAHAASTPASRWAVPSLATLQQANQAGHAYSEVRLKSGPLPALKDATSYTYALSMNGQPLHIDGLPPDAYPRRFDAAQGLDLAFGLENLNASGRRGGYEDLGVELRFLANDKPLRSAELHLRYVALRPIDGPLRAADGDVTVQWSARYHPGRAEDAFQIFITSAPDGGALQQHKDRFDAARLTAPIGGREQPIVAVLRPPFESNRNYGLNVGLQQPNGQIRFSFDEATSVQLCAALHTLSASQPGLVRRDSYRRTLDGRKGYEQCARLADR